MENWKMENGGKNESEIMKIHVSNFFKTSCYHLNFVLDVSFHHSPFSILNSPFTYGTLMYLWVCSDSCHCGCALI
jgi:hypothetical protein